MQDECVAAILKHDMPQLVARQRQTVIQSSAVDIAQTRSRKRIVGRKLLPHERHCTATAAETSHRQRDAPRLLRLDHVHRAITVKVLSEQLHRLLGTRRILGIETKIAHD